MKCICPECKNGINLEKYKDLSIKHIIECESCGITLEVLSIDNGEVKTEIVSEGK
jgi:lysine biosynthesis protein LysW